MENYVVFAIIVAILIALVMILFWVIVKKANEKNDAENGLFYMISEMKRKAEGLKNSKNVIIIKYLDEFIAKANCLKISHSTSVPNMLSLAYRASVLDQYLNSIFLIFEEYQNIKDKLNFKNIEGNGLLIRNYIGSPLQISNLKYLFGTSQFEVIREASEVAQKILSDSNSCDCIDSLYLESKFCIARIMHLNVFTSE